jgi:hypothetical protein
MGVEGEDSGSVTEAEELKYRNIILVYPILGKPIDARSSNSNNPYQDFTKSQTWYAVL